jgi:hypothetical protein
MILNAPLSSLKHRWRTSASTTGPEDILWLPVIDLPIPERTTAKLKLGISNSGAWLVTNEDSASSLADSRVLMSRSPYVTRQGA